MNYSLIDYYLVIKKNIKIILSLTIIFGLISTAIAFFVLKPEFFSSGVIKASAKSGGLSNLISAGGFGDIGGLEELTGGNSSQELALYENILTSRRCIDELIIKFNLMDEYDFKYREDLIKNIRQNLIEITKDSKAGILEVGIYNENPVKAKEMVSFLIEQLNKINLELNIQNAQNNRAFIEERFNATQTELRKAEDSLMNFQRIYGISPDITVKAAVQSQIQLEGQIKSEEVKMDILKKIVSPDQPEIKQQEETILALKRQLEDIKNSSENSDVLKLNGTPKVVMSFLRLQRDVEIYNKILAFLVPAFENAKIEEKKQAPSTLVLDQPFVPEKKSRPKRMIIILLTLVVSFSFLSLFYIVLSKIKKLSINN